MAKEKKKAVETIKAETVGPKIYLGPNIPKYSLVTGQVYIQEDALIKKVFEEYEELRGLFVPVDEYLGMIRANIKKPGTIENLIYNDIKNKINGGK